MESGPGVPGLGPSGFVGSTGRTGFSGSGFSGFTGSVPSVLGVKQSTVRYQNDRRRFSRNSGAKQHCSNNKE